jgi:hypothetical protein
MAGGSRSVWLVRAVVWTAFAATLVLAGPRAWRIASARVAALRASAPIATVEVGRVGFGRTPAWLRGDLLLAVLEDLAPRLGRGRESQRAGVAVDADAIGLLDEAGAQALTSRLQGSPWIESLALRRRFPDRFLVDVVLRRPVLEVRRARGEPACLLVDGRGICLPAVAVAGLPFTVPVDPAPATAPGTLHPDAGVRAAAAVAQEWRTEVLPEVGAAPPLAEVDATNLGYRFLADRRWSEVRIGLSRADGATVWFDYDHPPDSPLPRVASAEKAAVLRAILAEFPDLRGLERGDLRMVKRWRDWLRPRPPD